MLLFSGYNKKTSYFLFQPINVDNIIKRWKVSHVGNKGNSHSNCSRMRQVLEIHKKGSLVHIFHKEGQLQSIISKYASLISNIRTHEAAGMRKKRWWGMIMTLTRQTVWIWRVKVKRRCFFRESDVLRLLILHLPPFYRDRANFFILFQPRWENHPSTREPRYNESLGRGQKFVVSGFPFIREGLEIKWNFFRPHNSL